MYFLTKSFSLIDRKVIYEVSTRFKEIDVEETENEVDPSTWNPPALHATDIYPQYPLALFKRKTVLKEVELTIKIFGPVTQILSLQMFTAE